MSLHRVSILLLQAYASVLRVLELRLGEREASRVLHEVEETAPPRPPSHAHLDGLKTSPKTSSTDPYAAIESAIEAVVQSLALSGRVEFHLWSFPLYRWISESATPIDGDLSTLPSESLREWIEDEARWAEAWIDSWPLDAQIKSEVRRTSDQAWLRFRSEALRLTVGNPLRPVL